jgi:predicted AAA+ superfamily ATPase
MKTRNKKELERHWAEQARKASKPAKQKPGTKGTDAVEPASNQAQQPAEGSK